MMGAVGEAERSLSNTRLWRAHLLLFGVACLSLVVLYWGTVVSLVSTWWHEGTYSHGFLIFPISAYLVYENRARIIRCLPRVRLSGLVLLGLIALIWAAAEVTLVQVGQQLAFVAFFPALVWTIFGGDVLKRVWFPLFFLLFSIPVWDHLITVPLQSLTAWVAHQILLMIDVPAARDEHFISIPSGVFHIATSCAGTRYFIAGLTLSTLFAYMMYNRLYKQIAFIVSAVVVYAFVNFVRVVMVIVAGHLTEMQHPWVHDHTMLGWGLFIVFSIPLFWFGMRFMDAVDSKAEADESALCVTKASGVKAWSVLPGVILALFLGPALVLNAEEGSESAHVDPPVAQASWNGPLSYEGAWDPTYVGASHEEVFTYEKGMQRVYFYYALYAKQAQGKELADRYNTVYDRETWTPELGGETRTLKLNVWPYRVNETVIRSKHGLAPKVVWQWYVVAGRVTANRQQAKLFELFKLINMTGNTSLAVALAVDGSDVDRARGELKRFVTDMTPELKKL